MKRASRRRRAIAMGALLALVVAWWVVGALTCERIGAIDGREVCR